MGARHDATIRPARHEDAAAIAGILNYYVIHTTATFRTEAELADERLLHDRDPRHPVAVAESAGRVVGFAALSSFRPRAGYSLTAEVGVYVHEHWHRRGIGRALVRDVIARGRGAGLHAVVAGCCTESVASIGLMESLGFTRVAHFREIGRKFDRWLDVVFLELLL
ncbi:MAG TPA: GNAT family N-acetyltransferase [Vicinamibacterales bacterium]|nr:GNAT family N-acetyltransferase [Vicinamibacterales bacterium]